MPKTLGEFEQSILFALLELEGDEAYGVSIRETIRRRTGRSVSTGAVYTTLDRLREHGLVASWTSEPTGERGGRRKRLYRLTPEGADTLARSVRIFEDRSRGLLDRLQDRAGAEAEG
ncbi:MAG: PadR family transcriptional regulator [Longimicrobiales bacterium]